MRSPESCSGRFDASLGASTPALIQPQYGLARFQPGPLGGRPAGRQRQRVGRAGSVSARIARSAVCVRQGVIWHGARTVVGTVHYITPRPRERQRLSAERAAHIA